MKKFLSILFSMAIFLTGCAQTKAVIQNPHAYFTISIPGNIPVDDNGNPLAGPDTVRVIYMETTGSKKPVVTSVQYGNKIYSPSVFEEEKFPVMVGKRKGSENKITLRPRKGNSLWRIELTPSQTNNAASKNKSIVVKGSLNGRGFTIVIQKEIELESPVRA